MKIYASFLFALLLLAQCTRSSNGQTTLSSQEFYDKIKEQPNAVILDVRTTDEFAKGHVANAQHAELNSENFAHLVSQLDKTKPVFVYCLSGGRSATAATQLRDDGFKTVYELSGGLLQWLAANLPTTTDVATAQAQGMTKAQFDALTQQTGKKILVDFYAEWCGPCKKMKPTIDEIASTMADKVTVVRIDVDQHPELSEALHIEAIPVIQLYENGQQAWSNMGYMSREELLSKL